MLRIFLSFLTFQVASVNAFQATPIARQISTPRMPPLPATSDALAEIDILWRTYPYTAAALVCGFKASMADMVAQTKELKGDDEEDCDELKATQRLTAMAATEEAEQHEEGFSMLLSNADWKRNAAFIAYGALYQGITQEFFFNHMYPIWFGTGTGIATVMIKVAYTLIVQTTLLTLPSLYASKALIEGYSLQEAFKQYIYDIQYQGLLQKFYILWGPMLTLTFGVIPEQYRVTFVAMVSFFWLIILSSISGQERDQEAME